MASDPPFSLSVQCPTCSGRIRIRNPALVGQILACPRCQGLVLIQDEQEQVRVAIDEPADSQVETREAIEVPKPPDVSNEPTLAGPPPVAWESPQVQRSRQILLVSLIALFGMLVVSIVFWFFVQSMMNKKSQNVALVPPVPNPEAQPIVPSQVEPQPPTDVASAVENEVEHSTSTVEQPGSEKPPVSPSPLESVGTESRSPEVSPEMTANPAASAVSPGAMSPGAEQQTTNPSNPGRTLGSNDAAPATAAPVPMLDLPPELRQFIPLMNDGVAPNPDTAIPAPLTADELRLQMNLPPPPDERLHPPAADITSIRAKLEKPLMGLQTDQGNLATLAAVMEQVSGVPVWFDQATLDIGQVNLSKPLQVRATAKNIGGTLRDIATAAGCEAVESPIGFICIRLPDAEIERRLSESIKIDDLKSESVWMMEFLRRLAGDVDEGGELRTRLKVDPEKRVVVVEGDASVAELWRAAMAFEALRIARGLPRRLPVPATERWISEVVPLPPRAPSDSEFELVATYAMPLSQWVSQMAAKRNAIALIEWPAAWQNGLVPTKHFLPWTEGVSQQKVLDQLTAPYDLKVYEETPNQWWIGPETAFQNRSIVLAIKLPGDTAERPDAVMQALSQTMQVDESRVPAVIDSESGRLIIRLPRGIATSLGKSLVGEN